MGSAGFSAGDASYVSLALHPTTRAPFVAYRDYSTNNVGATVMTFDGIAWSIVGSAGFSAGQADYISLVLHPTTGAPYVAYSDHANSQKATVMTFDDGGDWVTVGKVGFSAGQADYISLALYPTTGAPYVAYTDYGNSNKATVMTFDNGSAWVTVGSAGFSSDGGTDFISLKLHPTTGAPWVAYRDHSTDNSGATVMTFDGSAWSTVGSAGFSVSMATWVSLALHPTTGAPFVAYGDADYSDKAHVMTFRDPNLIPSPQPPPPPPRPPR